MSKLVRALYLHREIVGAARGQEQPECLCSDCPPIGYPTDKTRCAPCPRRKAEKPASVDLERQYLDAVARAHGVNLDGSERRETRPDPARELPGDGADAIRALEHAAAAATSDSDRVAIACELWRARGRRAAVIRRWAQSLHSLFPTRRRWSAW